MDLENKVVGKPNNDESLYSIAISLKRIVDSLELSSKPMSSDEALKFYAAKDGC